MGFVSNWSRELKGMNDGNEGGRFRYPESCIEPFDVVHAYVLPYRQLEGFVPGLSQYVDGFQAPDYTTIWWRVSKMKVDMAQNGQLYKDVKIAVDSSGMKVSNRENKSIRSGAFSVASLRYILLLTPKLSRCWLLK